MNLLKETNRMLKKCGKTIDEIKFVNVADKSCTWDEFSKLADAEYDNGYGGAEVSTDLMIVGEDWWLERAEYDGKEWWEFKSLPTQRPTEKITKEELFCGVF